VELGTDQSNRITPETVQPLQSTGLPNKEEKTSRRTLPSVPIPPIPLRLVDGSMRPPITSALTLSVHFPCGTTHSIRYLVTHSNLSILNYLQGMGKLEKILIDMLLGEEHENGCNRIRRMNQR